VIAVMQKPSADVARVLRGLPSTARAALELQCEGDWRRVVVSADGSLVTYNSVEHRDRMLHLQRRAAPAARPVLRSPRPPRKRLAPAPRKEVPRKPISVPLEDVQRALGHGRKSDATTTVVRAPQQPYEDPKVWVEPAAGAAAFDWAGVDLQSSAYIFSERFRAGLPAGVGFFYLPDVLALYGLDTELCEATLRHPERVWVRPESFHRTKRYPVLGFARGDVQVILGMRDPYRPCVIAVYVTAKLEADGHHVRHTGGGGSKGATGLPKTTKALRQRLLAEGAELLPDPDHKRATVRYRGEDLGQVSIADATPRQTVETDWQRCLRRMHAIDRKEQS
jgi:hypothetical protein